MDYKIIRKYLEPYSKSDLKTSASKPFLKHLDHFSNQGVIDKSSMIEKWCALKDENKLLIYPKATMLMYQSNYNNNNTCPYADKFTSDKMLYQLKHLSSTGIVNNDGSINLVALKDIMKSHFKHYSHLHTYCIKKSDMMDYIHMCHLRDAKFEEAKPWYLPSNTTQSKLEWYDFFNYFTDGFIDGEQVVSIETFLQFYFEPDVLFQRVSIGELPVVV